MLFDFKIEKIILTEEILLVNIFIFYFYDCIYLVDNMKIFLKLYLQF